MPNKKQTENTNTDTFNQKKNELKKFSQNIPDETELPSVPASRGPFGWFDYNVTGNDLNRLTEIIQDKIIAQNKVVIRIIQEFDTIYGTFSALNDEYIKGILISLKAAEKANEKALKGIEGVRANQEDIKLIINQEKQVIQVLKNFKVKIENIKHLPDVDTIFANCLEIQNDIAIVKRRFTSEIKSQELMINNLVNKITSCSTLYSDLKDKLDHQEKIQDEQLKCINQVILKQDKSISKIEIINKDNKTAVETLNKETAVHGKKIDILEQQCGNMSEHFESKLILTKKEILELNQITQVLSKRLKNTQIISIISVSITCVLMVLIINGVL
jgi:hypothetical protein